MTDETDARRSSGPREALLLTAANVAASVLNYLFQVHAAAVLDAAAFGMLSAWLARVVLVGMIATVVQYLSLDHPLGNRRLGGLLRAAGVASLVVVGAHLVSYGHVPSTVLGASAVFGGILLYAIVGQLQARLQLGAIGVSLIATAVLRFALPFAVARGERAAAFYVAHAAAFYAGSAAAIAAALRGARRGGAGAAASADAEPSAGADRRRRSQFGRPLLLAFAVVVFPLVDVLVVSSTRDDATTGAYSRAALASRVVVFGGMAALQVLLPHELHAAATGGGLPPFAARLRAWLTPAMLVVAIVFAASVDFVILHPEGEARGWLYASCLAAALLVAILGHVNRLAAEGRLAQASAVVLGVVLGNAAAAALSLSTTAAPVTRYLLGALGADALVLAIAAIQRQRLRPRP